MSRVIAASSAVTSLSLPKLLVQLGAYVFTETPSNVATIEANHIRHWEACEHRLAH